MTSGIAQGRLKEVRNVLLHDCIDMVGGWEVRVTPGKNWMEGILVASLSGASAGGKKYHLIISDKDLEWVFVLFHHDLFMIDTVLPVH